jgi:hypothetical protein
LLAPPSENDGATKLSMLTDVGITVALIPAQRSYSMQDLRSRLASLFTRDALTASQPNT